MVESNISLTKYQCKSQDPNHIVVPPSSNSGSTSYGSVNMPLSVVSGPQTGHSLSRGAHLEDGSVWGWVVLGSIFCINLLNFGQFRSFGLYIQPMMHTFDATPSQVAWVSSIQHGLFSFLGPVASSLSQMWSPRVVAVLGGFLACIGFAAASMVTDVHHLYGTFSLFGGIGVAFTNIPALTMIAGHFRRRRGLANGIGMSGNALGGIVFPLLVDQLLWEFGLQGTILITGGLLGNICVCAMFWRPLPILRTRPSKASSETAGHVNLGFKPEIENAIVPTILPGPTTKSMRQEHSGSSSRTFCWKKLLDFSVLSDEAFWWYAIAKTCLMAGYPGLRLFLPLWAMQNGCTQHDVAIVFSVMAIADFFGRLIISGLSDWCIGEGRSRLYAICIALGGITTFMYPLGHDVRLLAIISGIFGFWSGACMGLNSSVIADQFGGCKVTVVAAMINIFSGVAGLLAPPMLGQFSQWML